MQINLDIIHDMLIIPYSGFSDQEIVFDVEENHDELLSGDDLENLPRSNIL